MVYYRYFEFGEDGNPIQKDYNPKDSKTGRLHFIHSLMRKVTIRCRPNSSIDEDRPTHDNDPVPAAENRGASKQGEETMSREFFEFIGYYSHVEPDESSNPPRFKQKGIFCESFYCPIQDIALPEDGDLFRLLNEATPQGNYIGANQAFRGQPRNTRSGYRYSADGVTQGISPIPGYRRQPSNPIPVPAVSLGTGGLSGLDALRSPRNGNTDFQFPERVRGNGRQWTHQSDLPLQNNAVRRQSERPFMESILGHQTLSGTRRNNRPLSHGSVNQPDRDYGVFVPAYLRGLLDASYPVIPDEAYAEYWAALQQYDCCDMFF